MFADFIFRDEGTTNVEEATDPWEDLKKETGFASYGDYLEAYAKNFRPIENLSRYYHMSGPYIFDPKPDCSIIDLSRGSDSNLSSRLLDYDYSIEKSAIALLKDLRHPPSNSVCRILLWWLAPDSNFPINLCRILGLALRISPHFLIALGEASGFLHDGSLQTEEMKEVVHSFSPSHTILGQHISMIARNYLPEQEAAPPVVLIVGWEKRYWGTTSLTKARRLFAQFSLPRRWKERDLYDSPPFQESNAGNGEFFLKRKPSESIHHGTRAYQKALDRPLGLKCNTHVPDEDIMILCLMPLMSLETISLQMRSRLLQAQARLITENQEELEDSSEVFLELQEQSSRIRRYIGNSDASQRSFTRSLRSQKGCNWLEDETYLTLKENLDRAISDARFLEAEARDLIQLRAAKLSLQESQKSIELSNRQIQENKRGTSF